MAISIITEFPLKIFGKKAHLHKKIVTDSDRRRIGKGLLTQRRFLASIPSTLGIDIDFLKFGSFLYSPSYYGEQIIRADGENRGKRVKINDAAHFVAEYGVLAPIENIENRKGTTCF